MSWLSVIGIGEDGWDGLSGPTKAALEAADIIVGGERHHGLAPNLPAKRVFWPSPFSAMRDQISGYEGQQVAVLVTGDPLWYSVGAYFAKNFAEACVFFPQISAFQWAAVRLGWSLADVETLTIHGRPAEKIIANFAPKQRLLLLTKDETTPATVAELLVANGFGPSKMVVLGALGGNDETRTEGVANTWNETAPAFHLLAVECVADENARLLPRTGLPDDAFVHDGQMTKREVRIQTLAALDPRRGALLWDLGSGCGSVAIEWMRAAHDSLAIGVERSSARRDMAAKNALKLGAPLFKQIDANVAEAIDNMPDPDAIFIGGGLDFSLAEQAVQRLSKHGRLVANAVTLESECTLAALHEKYGGQLIHLAVSRAIEVGAKRGWKSSMPVTQWIYVK